MKKKIILGLICLLSLTPVVNAEELSEPLNSIVKDGTLYIDTQLPKSESEFNAVKSILNEQYKEYLQDDETSYDKNLSIGECSEDYLACSLYYTGCLRNEGCGTVPVEVKIKWQEDTVDNYSEEFKAVAPDGTISIAAIAPKNEMELDNYTYDFSLEHKNFSLILNTCDDTYTSCDLVYSNGTKSEVHNVKVTWATPNPTVKKQIDENIKELTEKLTTQNGIEKTYIFSVLDLNLINYLSHLKSEDQGTDMDVIANYSQDLKDMFKNANFSYEMQPRMGDAQILNSFVGGSFNILYDGTIYGTIDGTIGIEQKNVIYIADENENTKEAYIAAAKKRIDEYLENDSTTIEVAGTIKDYIDEYGEKFDFSRLGDTSKMGEYYYNIKIGNVTKPFVIIKDSSKIEKVELSTTDSKTGISISTENTTIPLDTKIEVEEIVKSSEAFKQINEVLKLEEKEEVQVYDFKLFSKVTNNFITKLTTGEFKVSVPIKESLRNKKLVAYYITDDKKIEEHPVTVVGDKATFTTTHFSIYTISEAKQNNIVEEPKKELEDELIEEVPNTFDGIMTYIFIGTIGLIGLGATSIFLKKREN